MHMRIDKAPGYFKSVQDLINNLVNQNGMVTKKYVQEALKGFYSTFDKELIDNTLLQNAGDEYLENCKTIGKKEARKKYQESLQKICDDLMLKHSNDQECQVIDTIPKRSGENKEGVVVFSQNILNPGAEELKRDESNYNLDLRTPCNLEKFIYKLHVTSKDRLQAILKDHNKTAEEKFNAQGIIMHLQEVLPDTFIDLQEIFLKEGSTELKPGTKAHFYNLHHMKTPTDLPIIYTLEFCEKEGQREVVFKVNGIPKLLEDFDLSCRTGIMVGSLYYGVEMEIEHAMASMFYDDEKNEYFHVERFTRGHIFNTYKTLDGQKLNTINQHAPMGTEASVVHCANKELLVREDLPSEYEVLGDWYKKASKTHILETGDCNVFSIIPIDTLYSSLTGEVMPYEECKEFFTQYKSLLQNAHLQVKVGNTLRFDDSLAGKLLKKQCNNILNMQEQMNRILNKKDRILLYKTTQNPNNPISLDRVFGNNYTRDIQDICEGLQRFYTPYDDLKSCLAKMMLDALYHADKKSQFHQREFLACDLPLHNVGSGKKKIGLSESLGTNEIDNISFIRKNIANPKERVIIDTYMTAPAYTDGAHETDSSLTIDKNSGLVDNGRILVTEEALQKWKDKGIFLEETQDKYVIKVFDSLKQDAKSFDLNNTRDVDALNKRICYYSVLDDIRVHSFVKSHNVLSSVMITTTVDKGRFAITEGVSLPATDHMSSVMYISEQNLRKLNDYEVDLSSCRTIVKELKYKERDPKTSITDVKNIEEVRSSPIR
ncbi:MAG: hypothetical protein P857_332 [Candidatus Xenolissoclinum pacificiensis L6]|uniref:Uncharacterized protein n=1 Tax=Candidatus Xenolissoclinum pacificiensis L6 TaxID=1401685 RepID=W2V181_9RICK|nr:MAG: hypothetical protein P857_332 [Candidatus Xenolissoclinum pacificiensis L6]